MMYTQEVEADVLAGNPDFVLDAIDNIETKVQTSFSIALVLKVFCQRSRSCRFIALSQSCCSKQRWRHTESLILVFSHTFNIQSWRHK